MHGEGGTGKIGEEKVEEEEEVVVKNVEYRELSTLIYTFADVTIIIILICLIK